MDFISSEAVPKETSNFTNLGGMAIRITIYLVYYLQNKSYLMLLFKNCSWKVENCLTVLKTKYKKLKLKTIN